MRNPPENRRFHKQMILIFNSQVCYRESSYLFREYNAVVDCITNCVCSKHHKIDGYLCFVFSLFVFVECKIIS
jgi:hypothetical protein